MTLLGNSQNTLSDSTCCVPCSTLKKALLLKTDYIYIKNQLKIVRDSTNILSRISLNKDSIIVAKDSSILLYKRNETDFINIIKNKNQEIDLWIKENKKQKKYKKIAFGIGVGFFILGTIIAL